MSRRAALLLPALSLTVALTGCAGQDAPGTAASPAATGGTSAIPSAPSQTPAPAPASTPAPAPSPTPTARVIAVTVAAGAVSGVEQRVEVGLGEQVVVRVTSDVAEEVHVHGYDISADVPAGGTVELPLTADIPGGFEVELEGSHQLLFQLRVA